MPLRISLRGVLARYRYTLQRFNAPQRDSTWDQGRHGQYCQQPYPLLSIDIVTIDNVSPVHASVQTIRLFQNTVPVQRHYAMTLYLAGGSRTFHYPTIRRRISLSCMGNWVDALVVAQLGRPLGWRFRQEP